MKDKDPWKQMIEVLQLAQLTTQREYPGVVQGEKTQAKPSDVPKWR